MIITRTPFRISFLGGGSDMKSFYKNSPGRVISTSIDKYLYVMVRKQLGIVEYKYRINWSKVEFKNSVKDIEHPIIREALKYFKIDFPIEISTFADIPSNTGLGSSSAFAVGLVNALTAIKGIKVTKYDIANIAAKLEIDILKRNIGKQDHFACSYGGLNSFTFEKNEKVTVEPILISKKNLSKLEDSILLGYTKLKRDASDVLKVQKKLSSKQILNFKKMIKLVKKLENNLLTNNLIIKKIGRNVDQSWLLKKEINPDATNTNIDNFYTLAKKSGSYGGKLLGAGRGGFILLFSEKKNVSKLKKNLKKLKFIPIKFDKGSGSRITYFDHSNF